MEVRPISKTKRISPVKQFFYDLLRVIVIALYHLFYNIRWEGTENVPKDGGNIFASNHRSYQDPVFIALHTKVPLSYMAKDELFQGNKAFKVLITAFGAFPVTRGKGDTAVIDTSIEKLEMGRNLAIFPEGTRSKDGKVGKGKTGVALIAAVAQTKIIPVGITFEGKLKFRKKVVVRYGKPIIPSEIGAAGTDSKSLKVLKNKVMEEITSLVHE
nr:lysophospholipid acyltransferase family protein [Ruminococcus sp.]